MTARVNDVVENRVCLRDAEFPEDGSGLLRVLRPVVVIPRRLVGAPSTFLCLEGCRCLLQQKVAFELIGRLFEDIRAPVLIDADLLEEG